LTASNGCSGTTAAGQEWNKLALSPMKGTIWDSDRRAICHWAWQMVSIRVMDNIVAMDQFGRLALPERIRKALHVSPPAAFKAEVTGNKVELTPIIPESGAVLMRRKGLLVVSTGGKKFNATEALKIVREERT
jgi:bifunctional DNA-binding transcriptional regulator/antitoxin component of YhaV-PrlF toxin-antitoxin module